VNVTGHCAAFNLAGPFSRSVLQTLCDIDLDAKAFPYLGMREGSVAGMPARLMRVGFVGELGFEIHVPFSLALHVWNTLLAAGREHGIRPFGVEAQRQLRLEKGHLIIGQDTDGLTNPIEANASWAVKMDKRFFIGQRSLKIFEARGARQKLVGFELKDPSVLPKECCLIIDRETIAGRITSIARSATLGKAIGLAMVRTDLSAPGTPITIRNEDGRLIKAQIVMTPFYDPKNAKQKSETPS
jgi:sarcosine oxidase subunit alpha